jgi:hypothetical protein
LEIRAFLVNGCLRLEEHEFSVAKLELKEIHVMKRVEQMNGEQIVPDAVIVIKARLVTTLPENVQYKLDVLIVGPVRIVKLVRIITFNLIRVNSSYWTMPGRFSEKVCC